MNGPTVNMKTSNGAMFQQKQGNTERDLTKAGLTSERSFVICPKSSTGNVWGACCRTHCAERVLLSLRSVCARVVPEMQPWTSVCLSMSICASSGNESWKRSFAWWFFPHIRIQMNGREFVWTVDDNMSTFGSKIWKVGTSAGCVIHFQHIAKVLPFVRFIAHVQMEKISRLQHLCQMTLVTSDICWHLAPTSINKKLIFIQNHQTFWNAKMRAPIVSRCDYYQRICATLVAQYQLQSTLLF